MKKLLAILILATLSVAGIAADRTLLIRSGGNILMQPSGGFNASDSIITSATYTINITNIQKYAQNQAFTFTLTDVDGGSPSVAVTAYGRVSSNGSWVQIGSPVTWTTTGNNPSTISSTAPVNYNYLKVEFVASGATQHLKIATFDCRTSNAFEVPTSAGTITFSRPTSGTVTLQVADDNANAAAVYRAGGTGALTLGAATGTTAITSSDWAIGATGAMTGIGAITADGLVTGTLGATISGATTSVNASSNFATNLNTGTSTGALSLGGGSGTVAVNSSSWDISTAGAVSGVTTLAASGSITATGGLALATQPSVYWAAGGAVQLATAGTDITPTAGTRYWVEVNIPYNSTITGLAFLVGSVGGTDSVIVQLHNSAGTQVASNRATPTRGSLVGTAAQFQSVAFATPYAAVSGKYYASIQVSGNTCRLRAYPIPGSKFITGSAAGTYATMVAITPGTTFTADKGPILMTY